MSSSSQTSDLRTPISSSTDDVLVRVEGVSKKFCRDLKKSLWYGVKDVAAELNPFGSNNVEAQGTNHKELPPLREGEFWAVKDVSFELRRGECLGLIGRNGAGKTTLLKMLNGLIKPDSGSIEMRGRVGALIALGAGFNPILTGRENIYVNGSILGLNKREIDGKLDEIIAFSEIGEFIDSPVQSYSSGMQVRLGFAVASAMNPDVLILDEVLAVGDRLFRTKCMARISDLLEQAAVILVSHDEAQIRQKCNRVLWLDRGREKYQGASDCGLREYTLAGQTAAPNALFTRYPIVSVSSNLSFARTNAKQSLTANFRIECEDETLIDYVVATVESENGHPASQSIPQGLPVKLTRGINQMEIRINELYLASGNYKFSLLCSSHGGISMAFNALYHGSFNVDGSNYLWASFQPPAAIECHAAF